MYRKYKSGYYSNNSIKYNKIINNKSKNISFLLQEENKKSNKNNFMYKKSNKLFDYKIYNKEEYDIDDIYDIDNDDNYI